MATLTQTPACAQKVDGVAEAGGFCREEFQAFSKYFADPLIQQAIQKRCDEAGDVLVTDTQTFQQVVDSWRAKLQGAYDCMLPGTARAKDANRAWSANRKVPQAAYKPTTGEGQMPYFVTLDRSTAQNFWVKNRKQHLEAPGFPVLQIIKMPPRGHDLHQIVEHAIGAMKSHVYRVLGEARQCGRVLTTAMAAEAVQAGILKYTAESWTKNLFRLLECVQIIAAERGELIQLKRKDQNDVEFFVEVRGTGGRYCHVAWS